MLRPGAVGDTLLAVPALRALRERFPSARVELAAHGAAAALLQTVGEVDRGTAFDDPTHTWLFGGVLEPGGEKPEVMVGWLSDPDGRVRGAVESAGVERWVVASSRPPEDGGVHAARYLLDSLAPLGVAAPDEWAGISLRVPARPNASVLLHPGSGAARKNWPAERFATVVGLLERAGVVVRLVVGEADAAATREVEEAVGRRMERLAGRGLLELGWELAGCRAYLGNDSGVSHLAGLVGAPTFVLFGPTRPQVWRPLGPRVTPLDFGVDPEEVARVILAQCCVEIGTEETPSRPDCPSGRGG